MIENLQQQKNGEFLCAIIFDFFLFDLISLLRCKIINNTLQEEKYVKYGKIIKGISCYH